MHRIQGIFTGTLSILLFGFAPGCVDEAEPTTNYDELAELVSANAQLDDWDICALDGAQDIDAPACPDASVSETPAAPTSELLAPEAEEESCYVSCGEGCCFFVDPWGGGWICCTAGNRPAQCIQW